MSQNSRLTNVMPAIKQQFYNKNTNTNSKIELAKLIGKLATVSKELKANVGSNINASRETVNKKYMQIVLDILKMIQKEVDSLTIQNVSNDINDEEYLQHVENIESHIKVLQEHLISNPGLTTSNVADHVSNVHQQSEELYNILYEGFSISNTESQNILSTMKTKLEKSIEFVEKILNKNTSGGSIYKKSKITIPYKNQKRCIYVGPRGGQYIIVNKKYTSVKKL